MVRGMFAPCSWKNISRHSCSMPKTRRMRTAQRSSRPLMYTRFYGSYIWLATHLSRNMRKRSRNAKNKKGIRGISRHFFSILCLIFCILCHGWYLREKSNDFLNEIWNLNEMRKVYSECFVFSHETPTKCEIR